MPARTGKCINFGLCNEADKKELFTIAEGQEFVCSECDKTLQPLEVSRSAFPKNAFLGFAFLLSVALGYFLWPKPMGSLGEPVSGGTVILRLSGSNTIGAALAPALAEEFLKRLGATNVKTTRGSK